MSHKKVDFKKAPLEHIITFICGLCFIGLPIAILLQYFGILPKDSELTGVLVTIWILGVLLGGVTSMDIPEKP